MSRYIVISNTGPFTTGTGYSVQDTWGEYDPRYCPGGQDAAHRLAKWLNYTNKRLAEGIILS